MKVTRHAARQLCFLQVLWNGEAWAAADERRRRVHADATLAASAAHMAGPLVTSKHLQVHLGTPSYAFSYRLPRPELQ